MSTTETDTDLRSPDEEGAGSGGAPAETVGSPDPAAGGATDAVDPADEAWLEELTPRQIVAELDKYIVGQDAAKKAVAISLRNRWRRQRVADDLREEILPANLILIGPTGVGKTEIARRLARLAGAPFIKVEASKFTEVGYVGRDVESMVRDLVDVSVNMVRSEWEEDVQEEAESRVEERLLRLLLPPAGPGEEDAEEETTGRVALGSIFVAGPGGVRREGPDAGGGGAGPPAGETGSGSEAGEAGSASGSGTASPGGEPASTDGPEKPRSRRARTREKLRKLLRDGHLEERMVEVEITQSPSLDNMMVPMGGMDGMDHNFTEMLQDMLPKRTKRREVTVAEARRILLQEELERMVDMDEVVNEALDRAEQMGILFLDEIDKVTADRGHGSGPDVSREGVQRDLLPIVEGSNVQTKYGMVRTDHMLFIAAGAFHVAKPSDLVPELQGRFPIRVELTSLGEADFVRILKEPKNALLTQYRALIATEGADVEFSDDGIAEIARIASLLNDRIENIGARRLHTVLTTLLEDVLYELPEEGERAVVVDREFVRANLEAIVEDEDLRRYIL